MSPQGSAQAAPQATPPAVPQAEPAAVPVAARREDGRPHWLAWWDPSTMGIHPAVISYRRRWPAMVSPEKLAATFHPHLRQLRR